jgi:hypothetical protein
VDPGRQGCGDATNVFVSVRKNKDKRTGEGNEDELGGKKGMRNDEGDEDDKKGR